MPKPKQQGTSMTATVVVIMVITLLCVGLYVQTSQLMKQRSIQRMEEGVNTAVTEIYQKLNRDKQILEATADLIAAADDAGEEDMNRIISAISPLMETIKIRVLMPDNTVIDPSGGVTDTMGSISFEEESALGEHVSNRTTGVVDKNVSVLRHFVPVVKDGETVALVYGTTFLSELSNDLNIDNIYNASASVLIIDTENGDLIMDTWHNTLGSINDFEVRGTKDGDNWETSLKNIFEGKSGHMAFMSERDKQWYYMYYSPANINSWSLAVIVPESEAMKNLHAISRILLLFAALMAVAIAVYYIVMHRNSKMLTQRAVEQAVIEEKLHKAEAAERAKTMFLSNMSHDIRTPMNAILGFTTLAQANIDDTERVRGYLEKTLSSGNHLLSLINDILDMSRIESGKLNIDEKECSLSEIFGDIRNIMETQMQSKQLDFQVDVSGVEDEDVYCDKLHINQMLLNLLSNAMKFTPAGGTVSLTIAQKPDAPEGYASYEIRVKDSGIGMSEEFLERVFEPFERERTSTVSGIQGTGLGMPIAKSIVEAMGGTIEVQSEVGKGTEFIIKLPLRVVSEPKESESGNKTPDKAPVIPTLEDLKGKRLLVVDDNELNREISEEILKESGFTVETAVDGSMAVEMVKSSEPGYYDAILMDIQMPIMNGYEATRTIRALENKALNEIPIVAMTANAFDDDRKAAFENGMNEHVAKPIDIAKLTDTLRRILKK